MAAGGSLGAKAAKPEKVKAQEYSHQAQLDLCQEEPGGQKHRCALLLR